MTIFLRTKDNTTVVDIECWQKEGTIDMSVSIDIEEYSKLLLALPKQEQAKAIVAFGRLQELRGWLFEMYYPKIEHLSHEEQFKDVLGNIRKTVDSIGEDYSLHRVED